MALSISSLFTLRKALFIKQFTFNRRTMALTTGVNRAVGMICRMPFHRCLRPPKSSKENAIYFLDFYMFNGCLHFFFSSGNEFHPASIHDCIFIFLTTGVVTGWRIMSRFVYTFLVFIFHVGLLNFI